MNVVDAYDTTTPNPADPSIAQYYPANMYSHPDSPWNPPNHDLEFGEEGIGFFEHTPADLSWGEGIGKTDLTGHGLGLHGPELDLPLSDHSYPASSSTGSPASSNLLYPPAFTPDDAQWHHQSATTRDGHTDLLPPLQLAYPALSTPQDRRSSPFNSPHRRALNMPYHELSPRATPLMNSSINYFTPKATTTIVKPYPLVLSHSDMTSQIESADFPSSQRCVPLSELTAAYIPGSPAGHTRNVAVEPLRTSSLGALSVASEGVQPTRLVSQPKRPRTPYTPSLPSTPSDVDFPALKRPRVSPLKHTGTAAYSDADDGESEADDEDVYFPSRSPSPAFSGSNYSDTSSPRNYRSRNKRRVKGKVAQMMSAADALRFAQGSSESSSAGDESDVVEPRRKNQAIPIPVPVPHLTKKSRGRKVPYVDAQVSRTNGGGVEEEDQEIKPARGSTSRRGRGGRAGGGRNGERSFVCSVPGCGKCFVRGEHLKRHIRSIHTHEKPYPCPYEGCQKSFSRRDNLGQHVRLHLIAA